MPLDAIDRPTARAWAQRNPVSNARVIRAMFTDAINDGLHPGPNPFANLRLEQPRGRKDPRTGRQRPERFPNRRPQTARKRAVSLTRQLVDAGHDVVATDASPAMLELTRELVGARPREIRQLTLPDDPLPAADAIVGVGHALNYLPDAAAIEHALTVIAAALRPGGLLAFDICDLEWGRRGMSNLGRAGTDWAIITEFSVPSPDRFVREMTTFVANGDGTWRRDDERHENVLIDTATVPPLLSEHGVDARIHGSFGSESHPPGLHVVLGRRSR